MYRILTFLILIIIVSSHSFAQSISSVSFSEYDGLPCSNVIDLSIYKNDLVLLCNMGENYVYNGKEFKEFNAVEHTFGSIASISEHAFYTDRRGGDRYCTSDTIITLPGGTVFHDKQLMYAEFPNIYKFDTAHLQWNKVYNILDHFPAFKNDSARVDILNKITIALNADEKYVINMINPSIDTIESNTNILMWKSNSKHAYTNADYTMLHVSVEGKESQYQLKSNTDKFAILKELEDQEIIEFRTQKDDTSTFYRLYTNDPRLEIIGKIRKGDNFWTEPAFYGRYFVCSNTGLSVLNTNILEYKLSDQNFPPSLFSIGYVNNTLLLGGYGSGLRYVKNGSIFNFNEVDPPISNKVLPGNTTYQGRSYFFVEGKHQIVAIDSSLSVDQYQILYDGQTTDRTGYYFDTLRNGRLGLGLQGLGFAIVDSFSEDFTHITAYGEKIGLELGNVLCFEEDKSGRIWMGQIQNGIAVLNADRDTIINFKHQSQNPNSFGVLSMEIDEQENLWLGTSKGLFYIKKPHEIGLFTDSIFAKAEKITLPGNSNSMVSTLIEMNDHLLVGNLDAISFIPLDAYYRNPSATPIYQYKYGIDIPGSITEQNCIVREDERYFWIGTAGNALRFDLENIIKDTTRSHIVLQSIMCSDDTIPFTNNLITVPADKRNLAIDIGLDKNPSLLNNVFYDYTLSNKADDTIIHKQNVNTTRIEIPYIAPGNYSLSITAKKQGLKMDTLSARVDVRQNLSESPWFWVLVLGIVSLLIIAFLWNRNSLNKEKLAKEQLKSSLDKTRIESIISSFNPHFIHNSLHWIQSRYNEDDRLTDLIAKLSENIRFIYTNTAEGKPIHALNEELRLVENYINIQLLRFSNRFHYIPPDKQVTEKFSDTNIPLMQLQIHVENAIEHGIKHQTAVDETYVKITVEEDGENLIFRVIDNGIGRAKASQMPSSGSNSGVKMMNDLHKILNAHNQNKISQEYIDHFFGTYGTCVIITIPKSLSYEI